MKYKKIITLTLAAALTLFSILIGIKQAESHKGIQHSTEINPNLVTYFNLNTFAADQFSSLDNFIPCLNALEKNIWTEIKEVYNLNQEEFIQRHKELYEDYKISLQGMSIKYSEGLKALEKSTIECIHAIIQEFNLDPNQVQLVPWSVGIPASATDLIIFVHELLFNTLPYQTKKFIIGHELMHVINKDHSTRWALRNTDPIKPVHNDENNPLNKLCKFHELRADIMCSCKGTDYAQGAINFMQSQLQKFGELQPHDLIAYPTYAMREIINAQILSLHTLTKGTL